MPAGEANTFFCFELRVFKLVFTGRLPKPYHVYTQNVVIKLQHSQMGLWPKQGLCSREESTSFKSLVISGSLEWQNWRVRSTFITQKESRPRQKAESCEKHSTCSPVPAKPDTILQASLWAGLPEDSQLSLLGRHLHLFQACKRVIYSSCLISLVRQWLCKCRRRSGAARIELRTSKIK